MSKKVVLIVSVIVLAGLLSALPSSAQWAGTGSGNMILKDGKLTPVGDKPINATGGITASKYTISADPYGLAKPSPFVLTPVNMIPPLSYFEEYGPVFNYRGTYLIATGTGYTDVRTLSGNVAVYNIDNAVEFSGESSGTCGSVCSENFDYVSGLIMQDPTKTIVLDTTLNDTVLQLKINDPVTKYRFKPDVTDNKAAYCQAMVRFPATGANGYDGYNSAMFGLMSVSTGFDFGLDIATIGAEYAQTTGTIKSNFYTRTETGGTVSLSATSTPVTAETWYLLGVEVEDTTANFYVDGTLVATKTIDDKDNWDDPSCGVLLVRGFESTNNQTIDVKYLSQFEEP